MKIVKESYDEGFQLAYEVDLKALIVQNYEKIYELMPDSPEAEEVKEELELRRKSLDKAVQRLEDFDAWERLSWWKRAISKRPTR